MKKTLTSIATALIMITSFSSFAAEKTNPLKYVASNKIIETYLAATTFGSIDFNNFLFTTDFEYTNSANGDRFNKLQYTDFLKAHKGIRYDCTTSYEILDQTGKACMAKVTMKFNTFTRIDYITLNNTAEGWKVNKVATTYP
ncbi:nuclear transport factor 2 family protein [Sphingobacterium suaedae]|uniref:Nuclear transport factor 2 family protein n=1 Tax=Sphingobacterium suaedae TaxID=1686402 RepID=A0ABW5KJM2_9SPHI